MSRLQFSICGLAFAILPLCASPALSDSGCPAGRALDGNCLNPALFDTLRDTTTVFAQPNLSSTHFPLLPSGDWTLRYPNQLTGAPQQIAPSRGVPSTH